MEHRLCRRMPVKIYSQIFSLHQSTRAGIIQNISSEGALISLPTPQRFPVNSIVEINLSFSVNGTKYEKRLTAMVVHRNSKTLGLMFMHDDLSLSKSLCKAIKALAVDDDSIHLDHLPASTKYQPERQKPDLHVANG